CCGRTGRYSCPGRVPERRTAGRGRLPVARLSETIRGWAERAGIQAGGTVWPRRPKEPRAKRCAKAFQSSPRSPSKRGFCCHDYLIGQTARSLTPLYSFPRGGRSRWRGGSERDKESELRSDAQGGAIYYLRLISLRAAQILGARGAASCGKTHLATDEHG